MFTVDLSKVVDGTNHMQSVDTLLHSCVSVSIVKTIKFWYANSTVAAKSRGTVSEPIKVKRGVRQGSVLSLVIFKHAISKILNQIS